MDDDPVGTSCNHDYPVVDIVDHRILENDKLEYKVSWKMPDRSQCHTWEPEENLSGCKKLLTKYKKRCGLYHTPPAEIVLKRRRDWEKRRMAKRFQTETVGKSPELFAADDENSQSENENDVNKKNVNVNRAKQAKANNVFGVTRVKKDKDENHSSAKLGKRIDEAKKHLLSRYRRTS